MNDRPTPETDAESCYPDSNLGECVCADFARELERERDEAREKVEQQRKEIVRLNGATNHAGGTPLKIALRERDEANEELHKQLVQIDQLFDEAEKIRIERDEARKELEEYRSIAENIGAVKAVSEKEKAICERNESLEELKPLRQRTPETDDFELNLDDYSHPWKAIEFARKLERERDEAREAFVIATDQVVLAQSKLRETDKEREAFVIAQQEVITNLILEHNKALDKVINDLKNILR